MAPSVCMAVICSHLTLAIRWRLRCMALLADFQPASQITWFETCALSDSRQHPGAKLLAIMECNAANTFLALADGKLLMQRVEAKTGC